MKLSKLTFYLAFSNLFSITLLAQVNIPEGVVYPDTLWSSTDSFYLASSTFDKIYAFPISAEDTINFGTYGHSRDVYFDIRTDLDSLRIRHVNYPEKQLIKIPLASPHDTTVCILRFQAANPVFTDEYIRNTRGVTSIEIPAVYELANIIMYLSDCSAKTQNRPQSGQYVSDVMTHFASLKDHDLIKVLNKQCADSNAYWDYYYSFRENSICFSIDENNILQYDRPYKHVTNGPSSLRAGEFRHLLYLVQDFAIQANFYAFYQDHISYYKILENRQTDLLPLKQMWQWLEREFPYRRDVYRVIFSPLIVGSHRTQRFVSGPLFEPNFIECLMFINSSEQIDVNSSYSEELKEGLRSGVVFTEIDHNYVNDASNEYRTEIKALITEKDFWATADAQGNYGTEPAIFNEYVTHGLFCLYAAEVYDEATAKEIITKRVKLMERRGFYRFNSYIERLSLLRKNNPGQTLYELYGKMIQEMHSIKKNP